MPCLTSKLLFMLFLLPGALFLSCFLWQLLGPSSTSQGCPRLGQTSAGQELWGPRSSLMAPGMLQGMAHSRVNPHQSRSSAGTGSRSAVLLVQSLAHVVGIQEFVRTGMVFPDYYHCQGVVWASEPWGESGLGCGTWIMRSFPVP